MRNMTIMHKIFSTRAIPLQVCRVSYQAKSLIPCYSYFDCSLGLNVNLSFCFHWEETTMAGLIVYCVLCKASSYTHQICPTSEFDCIFLYRT